MIIFLGLSMDWFKGKSIGTPHIHWENRWFPVDFPLKQYMEFRHLRDTRSSENHSS